MPQSTISLTTIFDGWNGYNQSIINAIKPLTPEELAWRPAENLKSVGELVRHISLGRITWFMRMDAPGTAGIVGQIHDWEWDPDGNQNIVEESIPITEQQTELVHWLNITWQMIEATLNLWKIDDLSNTYNHRWRGETYAVTRQWTIWRVINHDLHHGGELSLMLGLQGIKAFELCDLFGHIIMPSILDE
jgi:uncharacterized damage-inducible protein DinB